MWPTASPPGSRSRREEIFLKPQFRGQGLGPQVKALITVEINILAQMKEDVMNAVRCRVPVYSYCQGKVMPDPEIAVKYAEDALSGNLKEEEVF